MATPQDIAYHQRLLAMHRALLAEHLRQRAMWGHAETPVALREGTAVLRDHILATKVTLRSWNAPADDLPEDATQAHEHAEQVARYQETLKQLRQDFGDYMLQNARLGIYTPIHITQAIQTTRNRIEETIAILQGLGVDVGVQRADDTDDIVEIDTSELEALLQIELRREGVKSEKRKLRGTLLGMYSLVMAVFILALVALIDGTQDSFSLIAVGIGLAFTAFGLYWFVRAEKQL
jgi:hypothetical protein